MPDHNYFYSLFFDFNTRLSLKKKVEIRVHRKQILQNCTPAYVHAIKETLTDHIFTCLLIYT